MGAEAGILGGLGALSGFSDIEAGRAQQLAIKRQINQEKMRRNATHFSQKVLAVLSGNYFVVFA